MITDFYSTKVPPPPEHLVRKIVPASSESSTLHQVDANIICRQCNEHGHHMKNCSQVTCHKCKLKGNSATEMFCLVDLVVIYLSSIFDCLMPSPWGG